MSSKKGRKKSKSKSSNPSSAEEPVLSKLPQCLATMLEFSLISQVVPYWQKREVQENSEHLSHFFQWKMHLEDKRIFTQ